MRYNDITRGWVKVSKAYIAKALKRLREETNMTADEVGAIIGKSGKTVNAWENGRGQPDAEMLIRLSSIYHVKNLLLEFDENQLLVEDLSKKDSISQIETIITSNEKRLLDYFRNFNEEGQAKALERLSEMLEIDRYKKCDSFPKMSLK